MELRIAVPEDRQAVISMSLLFHNVSPYSAAPVDMKKVEQLVDHFLAGPTHEKVIILLVDDGTSVGLLAAHVGEILFSHARIAVEQMWWVNHDKRTRESFKLLDAFEYWATKVAKADFAQLCTLGDEKLNAISKVYERRGFELMERAFLKELTCQLF